MFKSEIESTIDITKCIIEYKRVKLKTEIIGEENSNITSNLAHALK